MYALKAEWKKFLTYREMYIGCALVLILVLVAILPSGIRGANDFWVWVYNFNHNMGPLIILFAQVAGLSRIFSCERDGRTDYLIHASRRGVSSTYQGKILLGMGYAAATSVLPNILAFLLSATLCGGVPGSAAFGESLSRMPYAEGTSVLWLYGGELLFALLGGLCAAGLVMLISALFRRPITVMAVSVICFTVPVLLRTGIVSVGSSYALAFLSPLIAAFYTASAFAWHSIIFCDYQLIGEEATLLWRPILYALCLLATELVLVRLAWKRRCRK